MVSDTSSSAWTLVLPSLYSLETLATRPQQAYRYNLLQVFGVFFLRARAAALTSRPIWQHRHCRRQVIEINDCVST